MSTPTTAVATLPHYHQPHHHQHFHHPPYSHAHHQPHQTHAGHRSPAAVAGSVVLPPPLSTTPSSASSRLLPSSFYPPAYSSPDGVTQQSAPRPPPHGHQPHHNKSSVTRQHRNTDDGHSYAVEAMNAVNSSNTVDADESQSRKRRRSREPDWNTFYRNGLPKEIIVIDDSPEPEANTGRRITGGTAGINTVAGARSNDAAAHQPAVKKRRKEDDINTKPSGYHVQYVGSHTSTPHNNSAQNGGSTLSSDRTNSALHTTAPTSLSSNSQYDDVQAPLKRKRTTRQQAANEAKRRDVDGLGDAFLTYKPPPAIPKKAGEVHVRVVQDVSPYCAPRDDVKGLN